MLERLEGQTYYHFLDGYLGYNQIVVYPAGHENNTFTCLYLPQNAIWSTQTSPHFTKVNTFNLFGYTRFIH